MSDSQFQSQNNNTNDLVDKIVQASTLEKEGKTQEAIALYQEIVEQDPSGNYGNVAREALSNLLSSKLGENTSIDSTESKESEEKVTYNFWGKFNLRAKTTLILIGISTFSTIAVGTIAYSFANRSTVEQIKSAEQNTAEQATDKVAFFMRERFGDIQIMSNLTILTNSELRSKTPAKDKQAALDSFVKAYTIYDSVAVFDLVGNVIAQSTGTPISTQRDRSYFQAAIAANGPILSQPLLFPDSGMAVYLAAPVKDSATGKSIGIMRARMPVKYLRDLILTDSASDQEHDHKNEAHLIRNYLLDNQGQIVVASDQEEFAEIQSLKTQAQPAGDRFNFFSQLQKSTENQTIVTNQELVSYITFNKYKDEFHAQLPDLGWSTITVVDKDLAFQAQKYLLLAFVGGTLVVTISVAVIASLIGYKATQPIIEAADAVKKLGQGKLDTRIPVSGKDELADLGSNINKMAGQIQDLLSIQETEAKRQQKEKETLQKGVMSLLLDVEGAKKGDLTVRAKMTDGMVGSIADAFNSTMKKLQQLLQEVQKVSGDVGQLSLAGEGSVRQLSDSALNQAKEIGVALSSIDEINKSVETVANYAQEAAQIARQGSIQAKEGDLAMDATVNSIEKIRTTVANTSKKVKQLAESSQEIAQIVEIISGISEKTNLLAFNASVEAARAGEHGEGFRIVAEEVRRLADRITFATKDIQQLVTTIQQDTTSVLEGVETSTAEVVNGSELVRMTKLNLRSLAETSKQIDDYLNSISSNTIDQTNTSKQVNEKINGIALIAKTNSAEAQNVVQSLRTLVQEAENLQSSVSQFKLQA